MACTRCFCQAETLSAGPDILGTNGVRTRADNLSNHTDRRVRRMRGPALAAIPALRDGLPNRLMSDVSGMVDTTDLYSQDWNIWHFAEVGPPAQKSRILCDLAVCEVIHGPACYSRQRGGSV